MSRRLAWITTAVLGAAATLMTAFGLLVAILFLVLAAPLLVKGPRAIGLSGLLTGFGACWLLLLTRQSDSGGTLDDPATWTAVGMVPLAVGLAVLVGLAVHGLATRRTAER